MILVGSIIGLFLISSVSVYNNLVIDLLVSSATTPLFGSGGFVDTFNFSANRHGPNEGFHGIWDYPIVFCDYWNKYSNDTNMTIFAEFNLPSQCAHTDISQSNIYKYRPAEWLAIAIGFADVIAAAFLEWYIHRNKYHLMVSNYDKIYGTMFFLLSFIPGSLIIVNVANIWWYVENGGIFTGDPTPFDSEIISMYKYSIFVIVFFNMIILPIYKIYDLSKKNKLANDEHCGLIQE